MTPVFPWNHPSLDEDAQAFLIQHAQHWARGSIHEERVRPTGWRKDPMAMAAEERLRDGGLMRLARTGLVAWKPQDNRRSIPYLYGAIPINPNSGRRLTSVRPCATVAAIDAWREAIAKCADKDAGPQAGQALVDGVRATCAPEAWTIGFKMDWLSRTERAWQALKRTRLRQAAHEEETAFLQRIEGGLGGLEADHPARVMRLLACGQRDGAAREHLDSLLAEKMPRMMHLGGRADVRVAWQRGRLSAAGFCLLLGLPRTCQTLSEATDWSQVGAETGPDGYPLGWCNLPRMATQAVPAKAWESLDLKTWASAARDVISKGRVDGLRKLWSKGRWNDNERLEGIGWVMGSQHLTTPLVGALLSSTTSVAMAQFLLEHGANPNDTRASALHAALERTELRNERLTLLDDAGARWDIAYGSNGCATELLNIKVAADPTLVPWRERLRARKEAEQMAQVLPESARRTGKPRF